LNTAIIIIWIIIALTFLLVDVFTSSFLFVWFGIGALVALASLILGAPLELQIVIFLISSLIAIAIGYPWARKKFKVNIKQIKTREEEFIGTIHKSEKDIIEKSSITLDGVLWRVINRGEIINKGDRFKIIELKGNQIIIEKLKGEL